MKNPRLLPFQTLIPLALLLSSSVGLLSACAHRNKAEVVDTQMENATPITSGNGESVGVRDQQFVLQKKKNLGEELRRLEEKVRELDDQVYGNRDYDSYGLWGKLRDCRNQLKNNSKDFDAGPLQRLSDSDYLLNWKGNDDAKAGIEKSASNSNTKTDKLIALSEEDLDDHIKKLNVSKKHLEEKQDEITDKLGACRSQK